MLTINTTTRYGRPCLDVQFQLSSERKRFFDTSWTSQILEISWYASFHWHDKYNYEKLEHVIVMITCSGNGTIGKKAISGLNHIT